MTRRVDGPDKVTGRARYASEHPVDGVAYVWAVPSVIARGTIRSVDAAQALALPGVLAVITPDNAPRLPGTDDPELAMASPLPDNAFKLTLVRNVMVRMLAELAGDGS